RADGFEIEGDVHPRPNLPELKGSLDESRSHGLVKSPLEVHPVSQPSVQHPRARIVHMRFARWRRDGPPLLEGMHRWPAAVASVAERSELRHHCRTPQTHSSREEKPARETLADESSFPAN